MPFVPKGIQREETIMHIEIYADGFTADTETRHLARSCADLELGDYLDQIAFVRIYLSGPRQAVDGKQPSCQVEIVFDGGEVVSERAVDNDLHIAIYWALEHAGGTVAHRTQYAPWPTDAVARGELLTPLRTADFYLEMDRSA